MLGYCSMGRVVIETPPTITMIIAITMATMGRFTKKMCSVVDGLLIAVANT